MIISRTLATKTGISKKRRMAITAAVSALCLVAAGCASDTGNSKTSSGGGGRSATAITLQGDVGTPNLSEIFNPYISTELRGDFLIYSSLQQVSTVSGSFSPELATGHSFPNSTTLVFQLRSGVKWSNGTPFTAADVVFSFDLLKKFPALDLFGVWTQIKSVSSSGNQVTFVFNKPNVPFAATIAQIPIVNQDLWKSIKDPTRYDDPKPVGTGPYELKSFTPTGYVLQKNPQYWATSSLAVDQVNFPASPSSQTTSQLNVTSGNYDWAYTYIPEVQSTYVSKDSSTRSYWFPPGGAIALFLNLTKSPYNNVNFRRGISDSLDRAEISSKAVDGYMKPASASGLILPNLQKWLDPALPNQGVISENNSEALSEFAKAGYHLTNGRLMSSSNQQASMTITVPNSYSDWMAASQEIIGQLAKVGIKVSVNTPEAAQYQSSIDSGNFDAAIGGYGGTGSPYNDMNNAFNSAFATPINTSTTNNFERYKNSTVDSELATLAAATSTSAQKAATDKLEQVIYSQQPIIFLYYGGSWGLFQTTHFTGWPSAQDPYTLPTPYNYDLLTVVTHLRKV